MILHWSSSGILFPTLLSICTLLGTFCSGKQGPDLTTDLLAQTDTKVAPSPFEPWGYDGSILLIGSIESRVDDSIIDEFKKRIPKTHSTVVVLHSADCDPKAIEQFSKQWEGDLSVKFFALPIMNAPEQSTAIRQGSECVEAIRAAGGVWFMRASQAELLELSKSKSLREELHELLKRGGAVAACGESCGLLGQVSDSSGSEVEDNLSTKQDGFGLVGQSRIYTTSDFNQRAGRPGTVESSTDPIQLAGLPGTVDDLSGTVGLGIETKSTVLIRSRTLRVISGTVSVSLGPAGYRPAETFQLKSSEVADWTQFRRAARDRLKNIDPGKPNGVASLQSGALVIVGGGSMPRPIVNKFMELAGGSAAKIVYLPTAVPPSERPEISPPPFFAGAAKVTVLNQRGSADVDSDEFREALNEATAVWFGGGRQWNFVDAYEDTQAIKLFHAVLERGGVIGGSSAGATIQGEFLVRGHPLGNTVMMAEGYERGFSFLPGSAIDQHFAQRNRFSDLEAVVKKHRDLLGVGIDEGTALVVQPKLSEVLGNGSVYLLRSTQLTSDDTQGPSKDRFIEVPSGSKVDLISLEVTP